MAKNIAAIIGYGGDLSAVFVAPKGTTGPIGLAAPAVTYKEVGWLSTDGIAFGRKEDNQVFTAHQGGKIVKRKTASVNDTFKFQCLETTAVTLGILFKGQTPVVVTNVATITVTAQTVNDARAWVIDEKGDDGTTMRYIIPSGNVETTADVVYKTSDMVVYEFTVGVNGDYTVVTDAANVIA